MKSKLAILLLALSTSFVGSSEAMSSEPMSCIKYWGEARYVIGWNHLVHIANECESDAVCSVNTNVNPKIQVVSVPRQSQVTVVTFLGAPSNQFTPSVTCTF
jgi:hypothetical protein